MIDTVPLEQARPGMRLGKDLRDAGGAVLLAAGCELTEPLLAALRRRGIERIGVAVEETVSEAEREARREAMRARLAHLFRHANEAEADRALFEAVLEYRLEQLG